MRHWKVTLLREGRSAREWNVWAPALTIGSHGSNRIRLPLPVSPFALRLDSVTETEIHQVGEYTLAICDDTADRETLWSQARERMEDAQTAASLVPSHTGTPLRMTLLVLGLVGLVDLGSGWLADHKSPLSDLEVIKANAAIVVAPSAPQPVPHFEATAPTGHMDASALSTPESVTLLQGPRTPVGNTQVASSPRIRTEQHLRSAAPSPSPSLMADGSLCLWQPDLVWPSWPETPAQRGTPAPDLYASIILCPPVPPPLAHS